MRNRLALVAVLVLAMTSAFLALPSTPVRADGIEVRSQAATNAFPNGIRFTIFMVSNADITNVRLRFRNLSESGPQAVARTQCNSGTNVQCSATAGANAEGFMAPGAEVEYYWEIEDAAGQRLETKPAFVTYNDTRFSWETVSDRNVTVYHYFGDPQSVLRTARETIDKFSALEGVAVNTPVKIWVYQTARDLQVAAAGRPATGGHLLGQLSAPDTVLVSRDTDFLDIVRHEVAHFVTGQADQGFIAGLPTWVNEGISTYAQTRLLSGETEALQQAIRRNQVIPISSLDSTFRSANFSLFYAQSGAIIDFLVKTYGPEKFAQFIAAFRDERTDGALMRAYGLDQVGLENAWRRSLNLPEVQGGTGPSGGPAGSERPLPTIVPFGSSGGSSPNATPAPEPDEPSQTASNDDGGSMSFVIIGAAMAGVALALAGGVIFYRSRRARSTSE